MSCAGWDGGAAGGLSQPAGQEGRDVGLPQVRPGEQAVSAFGVDPHFVRPFLAGQFGADRVRRLQAVVVGAAGWRV
jgi:hypothetical protein